MYSTKDSIKTITRNFHDSDYKYLNNKEIKILYTIISR